MDLAYAIARRVLFALDAEASHELSVGVLARLPALAGLLRGRVVDQPVNLLGIHFGNRVGLAAGLDKNGTCIDAFGRLGFGHLEIGTVTPRPQPGNPRPRLFRLPRHFALINRMGFNSDGVEAVAPRLARAAAWRKDGGVLGVNIGKNKDTDMAQAADDYVHCLERVHAHADYVTVNISSPNTSGLRDLQESARLQALLWRLGQERRRLADRDGRRVPLLLKIAPDVTLPQLEDIAHVAPAEGIDGIIATNTTLSRPGLDRVPLSREAGGLSGKPLRPLADDVLGRLRGLVGPAYPLVGVGGILRGSDAQAKRAAGADLVQIYTGFIYRGPELVAECTRALAEGSASVAAAAES